MEKPEQTESQETHGKQDADPHWNRRHSKWQLWFNALLVLLGGIGTVLVIAQSRQTREALEDARQWRREDVEANKADDEEAARQSNETARLMAESNELTRRSVELAERTLRVSVDSFRASERPWVGVEKRAKEGMIAEEGKPLRVSFSFTNVGRGPALNAISCVLLDTSGEIATKGERPPNCGQWRPRPTGYEAVMIPNTGIDLSVETDHPMTKADLAAFGKLYYFGWIQYDGPFGDRGHVTGFCLEGWPGKDWSTCKGGNYAD